MKYAVAMANCELNRLHVATGVPGFTQPTRPLAARYQTVKVCARSVRLMIWFA